MSSADEVKESKISNDHKVSSQSEESNVAENGQPSFIFDSAVANMPEYNLSIDFSA